MKSKPLTKAYKKYKDICSNYNLEAPQYCQDIYGNYLQSNDWIIYIRDNLKCPIQIIQIHEFFLNCAHLYYAFSLASFVLHEDTHNNLGIIHYAQNNLIDPRFEIGQGNFCDFKSLFAEKFDIILADLGLSSPQLDQPQRGMSIRFEDVALDFRMDQNSGTAAWEILQNISNFPHFPPQK